MGVTERIDADGVATGTNASWGRGHLTFDGYVTVSAGNIPFSDLAIMTAEIREEVEKGWQGLLDKTAGSVDPQ